MHEGEESVDSNIIKLTEEEVEEERNTKKLLHVGETISGGELGQVELALSETVSSVQELEQGEMYEHVASSSSMSLGGELTEEEEMVINGNVGEEPITFVASTENSCSSEPNLENANQIVTPSFQVLFVQDEIEMSEDT